MLFIVNMVVIIISFFICHIYIHVKNFTTKDGNNMRLEKSKWRGDLKKKPRAYNESGLLNLG